METQAPIPNQIPPSFSNNKLFKIALIIIGLLIAISLFLNAYLLLKKETPPKVAVTPTPIPTQTTLLPTPTSDPTTNWKTYKNEKYGYEFKYPEEAIISMAKKDDFSYETTENGEPKLEELKQIQSDKRFEYLFNKLGGEICVNINYKLGYINVSAKDNNDTRYVICSPTGVGIYGKSISEQVTIGSKVYKASGMLEDDPNKNNLYDDSENLVVDLDNGTRIAYGTKSDKNATYEDYLKQKDELKQILSTFKFLQ